MLKQTSIQHNQQVTIHIKESLAMRKDISNATEITLRQEMASAILLEYTEHLLQTRTLPEVKPMITKLIQEYQEKSNYISTSFLSKFEEKFKEYCVNYYKKKNLIRDRFMKSSNVISSLKEFSDPNLVASAESLHTVNEDPYLGLIALSNTYYNDVMNDMKKHLQLDYAFTSKLE